MLMDSDHPDVARLRRALRSLVALLGVPAEWAGREPPAVPAGLADVLAKSLELDLVFVCLRSSNGRVAAHFAQENACLAPGDWLEDRLADGELLWRTHVASTGDDALEGAASTHSDVLSESRLSGCDARSAEGRCAQPSCLLSETLTERERDIVVLISQGSCNKQIARDLKISPETVKSHIKRIFAKLGTSTRAEAACRAGSMGLL
jgi:DNA-binding CsgD family transcriptional regulator